MTFVCQCCGECCSTMGEILSIREQTGPGEFRIGFTDGEERIITIDPDKRDLFGAPEQGAGKTLACPFLRHLSPEKRICTAHASRPELCRSYLCSRILVLDNHGKRAGRVLPGTRIFVTEDTALRALWTGALRDSSIRGEEEWEKTVETVLLKAGYRVLH